MNFKRQDNIFGIALSLLAGQGFGARDCEASTKLKNIGQYTILKNITSHVLVVAGVAVGATDWNGFAPAAAANPPGAVPKPVAGAPKPEAGAPNAEPAAGAGLAAIAPNKLVPELAAVAAGAPNKLPAAGAPNEVLLNEVAGAGDEAGAPNKLVPATGVVEAGAPNKLVPAAGVVEAGAPNKLVPVAGAVDAGAPKPDKVLPNKLV
jgi:hypothetical protein